MERIQIIEMIERNDEDIVDDLKASGRETMLRYLHALFTGKGEGVSEHFGPPNLAVFDVRSEMKGLLLARRGGTS